MNKYLIPAAMTAALLATPAMAAAPQGARAEAIVGYDAVKDDFQNDDGAFYGLGAGYDVAVSQGLSLGADVEATKSTVKEEIGTAYAKLGRDLYVGGRATMPISPTANVYLKAGYTNLRSKVSDGVLKGSADLDGYRLGAGTQFALSDKGYIGGEYRYSAYEGGDLKRHQVALTVGTRF